MSTTQYRVMKFGGSSVGSPERLLQVVELLVKEREQGPVAVVVSAMADTTDWLLEAWQLAAAGQLEGANAIVDRAESLALGTANGVLDSLLRASLLGALPLGLTDRVRELLQPLRQLLFGVSLVRERTLQTRDLVLSFGERTTVTVLTAILEARGIPAVAVDAREWTVTDDHFGQASADTAATGVRLRALAATWGERVPVHTGYIGRTRDGRTTTLGRNGSDYTAALLAQALGARELLVWTDVSGVMTADPSIVADAYPVAHLSQQEGLELANLGMRMFHPRTMVPLIESAIPMRIRNTMHPDEPGTLVDAHGSTDERRPTCVVSLEELALIDLEFKRGSTQGGVAERVLRALDAAQITVWIATLSPRGRALAIVVPDEHRARAEAVLARELTPERERDEVEPLRVQAPVTLLTLVAEAMGRTSNVAGRFFGALGAVGIPVRASSQGASSRSLSAVIDAGDTPVAVRTVHAAFNLAAQKVSIAVLGKGVVGRELLAQLKAQQKILQETQDVALSVVAIADTRRVLFDEAGLELTHWEARLASAPEDAQGGPALLPMLEQLRRLPVPILVDCTAEDFSGLYLEAFARGIHVVGANKKPLAAPWPERQACMDAARRHSRAWHYETTVGASLPVIDTLKGLVRTGDRVQLIEGSFSGTLGYLCNEVMRGVPLSAAVRDARERGYTEPHPRDDLSGLDAARKALILARELGLALSMDDVVVEPFVPRELLAHSGLEAFFDALERADEAFGARVAAMKREGRVLRYLARVDPLAPAGTPVVQVGPLAIEADHPASRLRGSEAFVAFTTERYREYPLIVQGAGAGGAVTAAGVLTDVLKVAQTLRGR